MRSFIFISGLKLLELFKSKKMVMVGRFRRFRFIKHACETNGLQFAAGAFYRGLVDASKI